MLIAFNAYDGLLFMWQQCNISQQNNSYNSQFGESGNIIPFMESYGAPKS